MKTSTFRIVPLSTEVAERARRAVEAGAADHAVVIADSPTGYPCRHCLRFAKAGERMILFPHAAIPAGRAYSESGPIFIHADACERYSATREYPHELRNGRAFRAYNKRYDMIDGEGANGSEAAAIVEKLLIRTATAIADAGIVDGGCYTGRL